MDTNKPHQTIEYYKSEIVKKEEIIEKLFEEVDDLKENRQEHNIIIKKLHNETKSLTQENHKKDQKIKLLETSYAEASERIKYLEKLLQNNNKEKEKREEIWRKQHEKLVNIYTDLEKSL